MIEEAAILYANGQDNAALASLEAAVGANDPGSANDQVWAMLFDLYQIMAKREAFEQRALEYSVRFEKSPPAWVERQNPQTNPAASAGGRSYVIFSGKLDETADKQIRQIEKLVAGSSPVRVEFTKVQDVDAPGAGLLEKAMKAARKAKRELVMAGAGKLAELLKGKIETGRREGEEIWLLLLEIYQHMGEQEPFEEWALNYAITFEVSPPAWEDRPVPKKAAMKEAREAAEAEQEVFPLAGEKTGAAADALDQLINFSARHDHVVIDCTALKRMDFVSAGMLLNTLANLRTGGKTVLIRRPNHLVCGLFDVLGISQVAQIERGKF